MNYDKIGADAFIGVVVAEGDEPRTYLVNPSIIEHDGSTHKPVLCATAQGVTVEPGAKVLILTMRNNLDFAPIQRIYGASESNGVIIGVVDAEGFELTGDYKFVGDVLIEGNAVINGDLEITGTLILNGTNINQFVTNHMHVSGTLTAPPGGGAVTGVTGAPL